MQVRATNGCSQHDAAIAVMVVMRYLNEFNNFHKAQEMLGGFIRAGVAHAYHG
jgi:hypothetical protein